MATADVVTVELQASVNKYIADTNKAASNFSAKINGMEKDALRAGRGLDRAFDAVNSNAPRAANAMRGLGHQTGNVAAQFQDMGVQLASGTSPFIIMAQQIPQITAATGSLGGALGGLRMAFTSLVSPVGLAAAAFILVGSAVMNYFSSVDEEIPDADDILKNHDEVIRALKDAYGVAEKAVEDYSDAVEQGLSRATAEDKLKSLQGAVAAAADALRDDLAKNIDFVRATLEDAEPVVGKLQTALDNLVESGDVRQFAADMRAIELDPKLEDDVRELAGEMRRNAEEGANLQKKMEELRGTLNQVSQSTETAIAVFAQLTTGIVGVGKEGATAIGSLAEKIRDDLLPQIKGAVESTLNLMENFSKLQKQIEQTPLGQIPPVYSGAGVFFGGDRLGEYRNIQGQMDAAEGSQAAATIKKHEGFRQNAYWDVNAWRTGFGSDTATRANGMIEKVTKETIVTLADAERDLSRRIMEFQDGIQSAIGIETWKSLSEAQQAALTSVAYNYGSLPKTIVAAIQQGGGPQTVATAIAGLSANPDRRKEEAQQYLSGTGITMAEAGLGATRQGTPKKTPAEIFQGSMEDVQARIDLMNAELEAQKGLTAGVEDYGYAVEKARQKQMLLNEAKQAGLTITPELAAKIDQLAGNYAKAAAAADQLTAQQKQTNAAAEEFAGFAKDVLGGFISDLREGKSASEALANALNKVADKLIDLALNALFGGLGGGGGGGFLASLFGGFKAAGGPVQAGKAYIVGEKRPELFVPNSSGRIIPSVPNAVSMGSAGGKTQVETLSRVYVDQDGNWQAAVERISQKTVRRASPSIISASQKQTRKNLPGMFTDMQQREL